MATMITVQFPTASANPQKIFQGNFTLATFSVIPSAGAIYTLFTSIDANGELVADPVYNNYTFPSQDIITQPGSLYILVINAGVSGITVQYKTF